jgi:hypothetical protein
MWVVVKTWRPVRRNSRRKRYPRKTFSRMFVFHSWDAAVHFGERHNQRSRAFNYSKPIPAQGVRK